MPFGDDDTKGKEVLLDKYHAESNRKIKIDAADLQMQFV